MIGDLFDFSFETYVTPRALRLLYGLWMFVCLAGAAALLYVGAKGLTQEGSDGPPIVAIACIIAAPVWLFFGLLAGRIVCEVVSVQFLTAQTLKEINRKTREP